MREIISMEIEKGVTIKLSDGTTIIGAKQICHTSNSEQKTANHLKENQIKHSYNYK